MSDFLKKLREMIKEQVPNARFNEFDYGYGLSVAHPKKPQAAYLVIPPRPDIGQEPYVIPYNEIPAVISWLKTT